ncbi:hypothetical protein LAZ67_8001450 [Cordylochernes scorpioides]|uniref:ATP-dependent DNA helicase n=1 Tax=Cordylochernes scorpioides TaxID=51811 RepID=A0ABY6KTG0_9ARAC|nr:hypothetical protein LAZ67_8001450 [Cordylochernes scorpioides]
MAHKHSLEALDRTLRDLKGNNKLMGGILLLLAGDFRQTLPVIPRSTPADEINACLKASVLWKHIKNITLRTNLRVQVLGEHSAQNFARKLLQIGEGTFPNGSPMCDVSFPLDFGNIVSSVGEFINKVFPNIAENFRNHGWLCERTILAPRNDAVDEINNCIQDMLPGSVTEYNSINTMVDVDDTVNYPSEFLNSLNPSGLPPHHLRLKIGSPIMLLRNLDPPKLCNGTRLCVKRLLPNVIEATILTGKEKGKDVLIPRIPLIPNDFPFLFKRLQFPVRLAFAITINKAQGHSLKCCGVDLESPCFSHGQLYVACSRVGSPNHLYIYCKDGKTKNIVHRQDALEAGDLSKSLYPYAQVRSASVSMELPLVNVSTCELRSVIRFFTAKNETAVNIHRNLVSVYGEGCMSIQMVRRWRSWFLEGRQNVHDDERSDRPVTATDNAAVAAVRNVVEANRRVTIDEIMIRLPPGIEIGCSSIGTIMSYVLNLN